MPAVSPLPHVHPTSRQPLAEILQAVGDLCTHAAVTENPPYAPVLAASVRKHLLTPLRQTLGSSPTALIAPPRDALFLDRDLACQIHALLLSLFRPPVPLAVAYDTLDVALQPLHQHARLFKVLAAVRNDLLSVLRAQLFSWMIYGIVQDPHGQFFVSNTESTTIVIKERLPTFISSAVADRILAVGNARRCVTLLASGLSAKNAVDQRHKFSSLFEDPSLAALRIEAASLRWRDAAAQQLSSVLPFDEIRDRVFLLRQYLLLGHSEFWRSFFDDLRTKPLLLTGREFDKTEREEVEKVLDQILIATTNEVAANDIANGAQTQVEPPLSLRVSESGDIFPQFSLSIAESQVLGSRSSVYCDVFSVAFNVRRVACELRAAFGNLNLLHRDLVGSARQKSRRKDSAVIARIRELRRRMANFVDGMEWYVQADVLQPKFDALLDLLDGYSVEKEISGTLPRKPFFDKVLYVHENVMDRIFDQCFIRHEQINARLNAIYASCFGFCDFVRELTVQALHEISFGDTVKALDVSFSRNVALLVRLLSHIQRGCVDLQIPALLVRIDFNRYVHY